MTLNLDFTEDQLCELWMQHTSLEDDPRDVNNDLQVAFVDNGELRQELRVMPAPSEDDETLPDEATAPHVEFARVRSSPALAWSQWARVA